MIKEIIRLKTEDLSNSRIAKALNLSRPTVIKYVKQFEASGFSLHELSKLSNPELHEFFEATATLGGDKPGRRRYPGVRGLQ